MIAVYNQRHWKNDLFLTSLNCFPSVKLTLPEDGVDTRKYAAEDPPGPPANHIDTDNVGSGTLMVSTVELRTQFTSMEILNSVS